MPNKLSDNRQRVSLAEDKEILAKLKLLAKERKVSLTEIYHEAVRDLLTKANVTRKK